MLPAGFDKTKTDGFLVTKRGELAPHGEGTALRFWFDFGADGRARRRVRQLLEADHAGHFFNQVFFNLQIKTVARRQHRDQPWRLCQRQTEPTQSISALSLGERHANDFARPCHPQLHRQGWRQIDLLVINWPALGCWRAADVKNQLRDAFDVLHGLAGIDTPLKAVPGVRRKIKSPGASGNRLWPPKSGFYKDVLGVV